MLGCSTDLDNLDRRVCRSVDGEREKSINSVFYSCAMYNMLQLQAFVVKGGQIQATNYEPFCNFSLQSATILCPHEETPVKSSGVSGISLFCLQFSDLPVFPDKIVRVQALQAAAGSQFIFAATAHNLGF